MENKKPIIIGVVVLVILVTGWVLVGKFKDLQRNGKPPAASSYPGGSDGATEKATNLVPPTAGNIFPVTGTVEKIENNKLSLSTDARGLTLEITPDYTIFLEQGDNAIVSDLAELKKGSKVKVQYNGPGTSPVKKFIPTGANQGRVTAIDDISMTLQMEDGEKVVDITAKPNIYLMAGETSIPKTASDLKVGSVVTIAYADESTRAVVVVIRIDSL